MGIMRSVLIVEGGAVTPTKNGIPWPIPAVLKAKAGGGMLKTCRDNRSHAGLVELRKFVAGPNDFGFETTLDAVRRNPKQESHSGHACVSSMWRTLSLCLVWTVSHRKKPRDPHEAAIGGFCTIGLVGYRGPREVAPSRKEQLRMGDWHFNGCYLQSGTSVRYH